MPLKFIKLLPRAIRYTYFYQKSLDAAVIGDHRNALLFCEKALSYNANSTIANVLKPSLLFKLGRYEPAFETAIFSQNLLGRKTNISNEDAVYLWNYLQTIILDCDVEKDNSLEMSILLDAMEDANASNRVRNLFPVRKKVN